jgi:hypothetical protein
MTYEKLAVLRALAARPSHSIAPDVQPLVDELADAGYVMQDQAAGWFATADGCRAIEGERDRLQPRQQD